MFAEYRRMSIFLKYYNLYYQTATRNTIKKECMRMTKAMSKGFFKLLIGFNLLVNVGLPIKPLAICV